jgi:hypothetical protein
LAEVESSGLQLDAKSRGGGDRRRKGNKTGDKRKRILGKTRRNGKSPVIQIDEFRKAPLSPLGWLRKFLG